MQVFVKNKSGKNGYKGPGEYIGRPSVLGNPFTHLQTRTLAETVVKSREEAVAFYEMWLRKQLQKKDNPQIKELRRLQKILQEKGSLTLICYCSPLKCHGDVLAHILLEEDF